MPTPKEGDSSGNGGLGGLSAPSGTNGSGGAGAIPSSSSDSLSASSLGGAAPPSLNASFQGRMQSLSLGSEPPGGLPDRNGIPIPVAPGGGHHPAGPQSGLGGLPPRNNNGGNMGDRISSVDNLLSSLPKSLSDVNLAEMGAKGGAIGQGGAAKNGVGAIAPAGGAWIDHVSG